MREVVNSGSLGSSLGNSGTTEANGTFVNDFKVERDFIHSAKVECLLEAFVSALACCAECVNHYMKSHNPFYAEV